MFLARTLTILSLTVVAILSSSESAEAGGVQDLLRKAGKVQVHIGAGSAGYVSPRPSYQRPGYPRPGCDRQVCPPPVRCVYCVYYLDCHHHWKFYGSFQSRWSADEAQSRLRYQGYRTYMKVKHVGGGYPGGPVVYNR